MSKDKLKEKAIEVLRDEAQKWMIGQGITENAIWAASFKDPEGGVFNVLDAMARFYIYMRREAPGEPIPAKITPPRFKDNYRMDCEWPGVKYEIEFDEEAKGLRISKKVHKFEGSISIDVEGINQILIT